METEEVIKLVDGIYKNILDKFNPGARQLISAGKAYLKALHGAAAASRLFNEALAKIAVNAQQGGTTDIGSALMSIVGVYKEIQDQHMNILKAFYVDLLVPLETNLEKDTKVVQFEQKKFLQQHKIRADSYSKATATMKKQRKKKNNSQSAEKEIKSIQAMEEEKNKLDAFCEQSLKNAMTQERRRYGFVLERQCSLAKHWMAYHSAGRAEIENSLDNWGDVAGTREFLPPNVENIFKKRMRENMSDDNSDRGSINSALRKTRSIDASCMDMRSIGDVVNNTINRAKSEYNLTFTNSSIQPEVNHWDQRPVAKALYAYLSSGENQLSFLESDRIALVGERAKGWQFGENLRTQMFGWFPLAYTESEADENNAMSNWESKLHRNDVHTDNITPDSSLESTLVDDPPPPKIINSYNDDVSPTRMFGDTIMYRQSKQFRRVSGGPPKPGPPPTLPAPVPTPVVPPYSKNHHLTQSHSFSSSGGPPVIEKRKPATMNLSKPSVGNKMKSVRDGVTNASLHSSNDSGFANEPPPQPEVDYSDEETVTRIPLRSPRHEKLMTSNVHIPRQSQQRRSNDDSGDMTLSRSIDSSNHIRQSSSFGNLTDENTIDFMYRTADRGGNLIKRTKSFWKFGKSDDILEGMALWKHRDLVQTEDEKNEEKIKESTLKRNHRTNEQQSQRIEKNIEIINNNNNINHSSSNYSKSNSNSTNSSETLKNGKTHNSILIDDNGKFPITKSDIDHRISKHNEDNIYGIPPQINNNNIQQQQQQPIKPKQQIQQQQMQQTQQTLQKQQQKPQQQQTRQSYINIEKDETIDRRSQKTRQNYVNTIEHEETTIDSRRSRKQQKNYNDNHHHQNDQDDVMIMKKKNGGNNGHDNHNIKYYEDSQENLHLIDDMSLLNNDSIRIHETNFYDDDECMDDMMMKTVKRKEILKQYYNSSGTDTEQNSSSSDPYDCIVVDDHLVRKDNSRKNKVINGNSNDKMEFTTFRGVDSNKKDNIIIDTPRTGTLLPRTKLVKASTVGPIMQTAMLMDKEKEVRDAEEQKRNSKNRNSSKAYGPWYDLWGNDASVKK